VHALGSAVLFFFAEGALLDCGLSPSTQLELSVVLLLWFADFLAG
jgi:hypothetical protein